MIDASKAHSETAVASQRRITEPEIVFEDFAKIDLRIARIIEAAHVEGAQTPCLKLIWARTARVNPYSSKFFPNKSAYDPADLSGKLTLWWQIYKRAK